MTHIHIQAIGTYNTLWFWCMVPQPHRCLYIEIYYLIILFQVTIYFQYVHDYFNACLRCCIWCHYYMFYGRLRFTIFVIVYAEFFMFTLFVLYFVRNDNNKDDQSINQLIILLTKLMPMTKVLICIKVRIMILTFIILILITTMIPIMTLMFGGMMIKQILFSINQICKPCVVCN